MTPPARGALNPPPRDRTELPRPRLQRPMPIARDPEVLASEDPTTGIDDRRSQGLLVRINPDNVARMIGRDQHMRGPRPALLRSCHHLTSRRNVVGGSADNIPVDAPPLIGGRTLLLGQADPRRQEPRPTLRPKDTRRRAVKSLFGSGLGSTFDPTRTVARAGHQRFNTGIALAWSARAIPGEGHTPLKRRIALALDAVEELEQEGDG